MKNLLDEQVDYYKKLHQEWKKINETSKLEQIFDLTLLFAIDVLRYQKCLIFVHDDRTGLFKIKQYGGYSSPSQEKVLKIINLLLSGDIIEQLRTHDDAIVHTTNTHNPSIEKLLKSLSLQEATLELFGGDVDVPFGMIVIGNSTHPANTDITDPLSQIALRHLISNLSHAVNTSVFYELWNQEKQHLQENIDIRTQQIQEQKETFEAIYNTSKDGIAILDVHTTAFLDANPAYLEMTGFTRAELLRTSCMSLTIKEDIPLAEAALQETINKGFIKDIVKSCLVKDERTVVVNLSMVLMSDHERILVTSKDITARIELEQHLLEAKKKAERATEALHDSNIELRQLAENLEEMVEKRTQELAIALEKAQAASIAKSNFLATMSHEIRTPMNGVLGMANLLMDTPLNEDQKRYAQVLTTSGQALLTIINDILDFSKIEAGKLELEKVPFNFHGLIQDIAQLFTIQAKEKSLDLYVDMEASLPQYVLGDPTRLRQIFFNLLSNAIKFTHQGEVRIILKKTDIPDVYHVIIQDTGIGISESAQKTLFSAFHQADNSNTRQYGGTGLGLAICSRLTELMQGHIWVESQLHAGTRVHVTFFTPAVQVQQTKIEGIPTKIQDLSYLRVLLVEDNPVNRLLATKLLKKIGITPDTANDGLEALDAVKSTRYDTILMDMQMPNMDGLTATRMIRAMKDIIQPHIIALTANAFAEDQEACYDAGMNDFVSKPIDFNKLCASIASVTEKNGCHA